MIEEEVRAALSQHDASGIDLTRLRHRISAESARRRRRRGWLRSGIAAAVAALALAATPALVGLPSTMAPFGPGRNDAVNVMLVGLDYPDQHGQPRAASITLLHVNAARTKAYLFLFPSGLHLSTPTDKPEFLSRHLSLIPSEAQRQFGVQVDAVVSFDPEGLQRMVNHIGGVEICVDAGFDSEELHLTPGCQRIDGSAAGIVMDLERRAVAIDSPKDLTLLLDIQHMVGNVLLALPAHRAGLAELQRDGSLSVQGDLPLQGLAQELRGVARRDLVVIAQPSEIGELPQDLALAVRNDRMDTFAGEHPEWVTRLRQ